MSIEFGKAVDMTKGQFAMRESTARWWVLGVVSVAQLMVILDTSIVNIALPSAQEALNFSDSNRQWVVTAYALAFGSLLLIGGRLSDRFGQKRMFGISLWGFAIASGVGGAASTFEVLVIARVTQGAFAAILAPAALALLASSFANSSQRGKAFGIFGAVAGAGGAIGLLAGGVITEFLSWRWCMYINVVFAFIAFLGLVLFIRRDANQNASVGFDLPGTVLVSVGLSALVLGLAKAGDVGWISPSSLGVIAAGVVLCSVFVFWQNRTPHPLVPLSLFLDRVRGGSYLALFVAGVGQFGASLFLTYYLQRILGYSPVQTGIAFLPMVIAMVAGSMLSAGTLVPRYGPRGVISLAMGITALGLFGMMRAGLETSFAWLVVPLIVMGVGMGAVSAPAMSQATENVSETEAGAASAAVNTLQQLGGALGAAFLNSLAVVATANYAGSEVRAADLHGYHVAFGAAGVVFVAGMVLCLVVFPKQDRTVLTGVDPDVQILITSKYRELGCSLMAINWPCSVC